jgi:hypothetical protein
VDPAFGGQIPEAAGFAAWLAVLGRGEQPVLIAAAAHAAGAPDGERDQRDGGERDGQREDDDGLPGEDRDGLVGGAVVTRPRRSDP